jgi:hypothetical protein
LPDVPLNESFVIKINLRLTHVHRSSCDKSTRSPPAAAVSAWRTHPLLRIGPFAVPLGGHFDVPQRCIVTPGGVPADEFLPDAGKRREVRCSQRLPPRLATGARLSHPLISPPAGTGPPVLFSPEPLYPALAEKIGRQLSADGADRSKPVPRRSTPPVHDAATAGGQFSQVIRNSLAGRCYLSCPRISPPVNFWLCTLT